MLKCVECGVKTDQVLLKDITNMKSGEPICAKCMPTDRFIETEDSIQGFRTFPIDPREVANQENPDISCDFCDKSNPEWVYDLDMEPIEIASEKLDFGKRWTACDACSKATSPLETILNLGATGNVTMLIGIHGKVMAGLSNKRPYVRDKTDGIIKKL